MPVSSGPFGCSVHCVRVVYTPDPSPCPRSSLTHAHRTIGYPNKTQSLTKSAKLSVSVASTPRSTADVAGRSKKFSMVPSPCHVSTALSRKRRQGTVQNRQHQHNKMTGARIRDRGRARWYRPDVRWSIPPRSSSRSFWKRPRQRKQNCSTSRSLHSGWTRSQHA
jgi:hypothetical protein